MRGPAPFRLKTTDAIAVAAVTGLLFFFLLQPQAGAAHWPVIVTVAFAVGGWLLRGVNLSGALAGGMVAYIVYRGGGWQMFAALFAVFVLTLGATRAGRRRKQALGLLEARAGRSAMQVAANLAVAAAAMVFLPAGLATVAALAALAEAAADTVSSEIGKAYGSRTYLFFTFREVDPGTNGGVSLQGTLAGMAAAASIAAIGLTVISPGQAGIVAGAGVAGMFVDSLLGAALENRGYLNNDAVNLLGTASAAAMAMVWV